MKAGGIKTLKGEGSSFNCEGIFCEVLLWILSIGIWASIIVAILTKPILFIIPVCVYFIYLVPELCSKTKDLISSQKFPEQINSLIKILFKEEPIVSFDCEIYTRVKFKDSEGNEDYNLRYDRTESEIFEFLSSRDVSGPLYFSSDGKSFVILTIKSEVNFADTISYSDYKQQRDNFQKNKRPFFGDDSYKFKETISINGIGNKDYLVNIYGHENYFISKCTFIVFAILTFGQIYKLILLCMTKHITFKIKKIISNRYDLSNDTKYDAFAPKLIFPTKTFEYNKNDISHINHSIKVNPPTHEELTKSLQYKDYIPKFETNQEQNLSKGTAVTVNNNYNNNQSYDTNNNIIPINSNPNQAANNNNLFNESNVNFNTNGNIFNKL